MDILGLCPVCEKGNIASSANGYSCNHFKSLDDKCSFIIYPSYFQKVITPEIAKQIIANRETDVYHDFISSKEVAFSAKLVIAEGVIKPAFVHDYLENNCPLCKNKLGFNEKAVFCTNDGADGKCGFVFSRTIAGYKLDKKEIEQIVIGNKTEYIEGFISSKGNQFGAKIYLEQDEIDDGKMVFNTKFDFELIKCPKCREGNISANDRAFGCSNWNNEDTKCDFTMWRSMNGKHFSAKEFLQFMEKGETKIFNNLKKKGGGVFSGKFVLGINYKTSVVPC